MRDGKLRDVIVGLPRSHQDLAAFVMRAMDGEGGASTVPGSRTVNLARVAGSAALGAGGREALAAKCRGALDACRELAGSDKATVMEALKTTKAYLERAYGGKPVYRDNAVFVEKVAPCAPLVIRGAGYVEIPATPRGTGTRSVTPHYAPVSRSSAAPRSTRRGDARYELRARHHSIASGVRPVDGVAGSRCKHATLGTHRRGSRHSMSSAARGDHHARRHPSGRSAISRLVHRRVVSTWATPRCAQAADARRGASTGRCAAPCGSRDASSSKSMLRIFVRSIRATKSPSRLAADQAASSVSTGWARSPCRRRTAACPFERVAAGLRRRRRAARGAGDAVELFTGLAR